MAKKFQVSKIPNTTPSVNIESFTASSDLPSTEQANKAVQVLTGQTATEPKATGRPIKKNSIGRVKYTTSLRADLVKWIKQKALDSDQTPADILEKAVLQYRGK